jgi:predicted RNase H-like HicB family nuclease
MTRSFKVILQFDPESTAWVSYVPDLENISTYGDSEQEALANTRELIIGYLEAADKEGIAVPAPRLDVRVVDLEVATA